MSKMVNIDGMRKNADSARLYKWDVFLSGPGPTGNTNSVNVRCSSTTVPQPAYENIDVNLRAFTKKEAGGVTWNPITFTTIEMVSFDIHTLLWNWGQKQFNNRTGRQNNKPAYEGNVIIQLLNLQDSVIKTWAIIGPILTAWTPPDLNSDKGGTMDVTFEMNYDYAELR